MTDRDYTHISLLVDHSGSMYAIREDAQGGVNAFIEEQRKLPGKCTLTLAEFDDEYTVLANVAPIADAPAYELAPQGMTALLDAFARVIRDTGAALAALSEDERPGVVIVAVVTDGQENSSRETTAEQLKALVTEHTEKWNWQFTYLSSDFKAFEDAQSYGVATTNVMRMTKSGASNVSGYSSLSTNTTAARVVGVMPGYTDEQREDASHA